jgi:AcrR family transcriptional regulator
MKPLTTAKPTATRASTDIGDSIYEDTLMKVKPAAKVPSSLAHARPPRRRRGELRVAALLEAAAATFAKNGYEAATMSAVAARAGAAIGSLYQFFPSKEALAEALLRRHAERTEVGLRDLEERARRLTPRGFADLLVARRLERRPEREAVLALAEAPGAAGERARVAEKITRSIAVALAAVNPALYGRRRRAMAGVILQVLKQVPVLVEEDRRRRLGLVGELRELLALYIARGA